MMRCKLFNRTAYCTEFTLGRITARTSDTEVGWREVVFSVREAQRALPYVARILRDAAQAYREVQECRQMLATSSITAQQRAELCDRRDAALHRLNRAIDECNAVGADLLDIPLGRVRFNAILDGRKASLIWRLGDPIDNAWAWLGSAPQQVES